MDDVVRLHHLQMLEQRLHALEDRADMLEAVNDAHGLRGAHHDVRIQVLEQRQPRVSTSTLRAPSELHSLPVLFRGLDVIALVQAARRYRADERHHAELDEALKPFEDVE